MRLDEPIDDQRRQAKLPQDGMALRVRHVGEFGAHAVAKRAGFQKGDIVVAFDDRTGRMTESDLLSCDLGTDPPGRRWDWRTSATS